MLADDRRVSPSVARRASSAAGSTRPGPRRGLLGASTPLSELRASPIAPDLRRRARGRRADRSASSTSRRRGTTARWSRITGTNGKTTVTMLVDRHAEAFGIAGDRRRQHRDAARRGDRRCRRWMCSSSRRRRSGSATAGTSAPRSARWLNFAPITSTSTVLDLLRARRRRAIWRDQSPGRASRWRTPTTRWSMSTSRRRRHVRHLRAVGAGRPARLDAGTAGLPRRTGDLRRPDGRDRRVRELFRSLPHDVSNALAAAATALAAGATMPAVREALARVSGARTPRRVRRASATASGGSTTRRRRCPMPSVPRWGASTRWC